MVKGGTYTKDPREVNGRYKNNLVLGSRNKSIEFPEGRGKRDTRKRYNERKLPVLRIVREREEVAPGVTPRKVHEIFKAKDDPLTDGTVRTLLSRYERFGYLKSVLLSEKSSATGKIRRGPKTRLYSLTEKGRTWLAQSEGLVKRGYPPRPGRYKIQ